MKKIFFAIIVVAIFVGCGGQAEQTKPRRVEMKTTAGDIVLELSDLTPIHRDNFMQLVEEHYFDSLLFHRVIENFMIQGGDPRTRDISGRDFFADGEETGNPRYWEDIPAEIDFPALYHKRGALAAAREGDDVNPERRSSRTQFYIVWGRTFSDEQLDAQQQRITRATKGKVTLPDSVSEERRKLVNNYGAEVILVHDAGNIGLCIEECLNLALKMRDEDKNVFVPQQFENPANPAIQRFATGMEILEQVGGPIHGFCSGIGTGGTITGIGETLKAQNPDIIIWAAEPENAAILSGGSIGTHIQMGIGDGIIPEILNTEIYDDVCIIDDEEALRTSKELASLEGIMCGISSGTNVAAARRLAKKLGKGKTVVTVLPDTAERYFSTPLFE